MNTYKEAHLFVAAIRVLNHKNGGLPAIEDVCTLLDISVESGHAISRSLQKSDIVEMAEDPFSVRLNVKNHLAIEEISQQQEDDNTIAKELEKFQAKKKKMDQKITSIQEDLKKKQQDKFADIEAKFKKEMDKYKK